MRLRLLACTAALAIALPQAAIAQDMPASPAGKEALEILKEAVAVPTVMGRGKVPELAEKIKVRLVAAGFDPKDVNFTPVAGTDTGYFIATYPGKDRTKKPIVINVHLDVVEAKAEDWERDPFVPVVENGYVFGRGSVDNKGDVAMILATVMKLKREGWVPSRDLVLGFSGDEETLMRSTAKLAEALKNAELVLNGDGGGGELGTDFQPIVYGMQAGEKTYADVKLTITDPGGHSSRPGPINAIGVMSNALAKIDAYKFPPQLSSLTKAYWEGTAPSAPPEIAAAMRSYAADGNAAAAEVLSARSEYIGLVRTTCLPTMVNGGHAANALPQSVSANINCRIFPGTSRVQAMEIVKGVINDPRITVELADDGSLESPESPLRGDVVKAVNKAVHQRYPKLAVIPSLSAGATDSMYFRVLDIPAYGTSAIFMRSEDEFSHGLNERLPLATIDPGVKQWETLLREIFK